MSSVMVERRAMGGGGVPRGGPPSHVAYYTALGGIFSLLVLLCCYFCYYFVTKVKELSEQESPSNTESSCRPGPATAYPVQPVVRESATAMARLCKQLPAPNAGKGGTVFPASTSPAPLTDTVFPPADTLADTMVAPTAGASTDATADAPAPHSDVRDKIGAPAPAPVQVDTVR